jgi:trimethylamine---corrinoid protein Co-methyltransferase
MKRRDHAGRVRSGGFSLNVFSEDELKDIHLATLEVLEQTGVFTDDPEAMDIFDGGGASVDRKTGVVKIPPHVVEAAVASAPERVFAAGRHPRDDLMLDPGRVGFTTFGEGIRITDRETGELREPTKQDVADTARLADALGELDAYEIAVGAKDVPPETATIHSYEAALCNTSKNVCAGPLSRWETEVMLDMAAAVVGGRDELRRRPIIMPGVCPVSPLKLPRDCSEVIVASARAGMPCNILSMAMAGGSAPVGLAGTLVVHNAEVLAGITLAQLTQVGAPVLYGSSTTAMDLRLAAASVGSPECGVISAAVAYLARQYRLPSYVAGL